MRKVLVSLLVLAMTLGLVGSAFAYSDTATNANVKYIDKASAFGWLKGYPDGSFKPAGNITRAEAAAVVDRALGLEAAAAAAKGLGTKFSDVGTSHWASGYVNVATNKGLLKGYPDGTFKPEANITNAEIVTMIVRALSRESDAVGEWPVGHITVAAANSIIDAGFVSNALANRADVARFVAKAADVKFKELTTTGWVEVDKNFYTSNNLVKFSGTVQNVDTVNKKIQITGTENSGANDGNYLLGATFGFSGPVNMVDLLGYKVDAWKNKDDGKLQFVISSESASGATVTGTIASVTQYSFYVGTTEYTVTTGTGVPAPVSAKITFNNEIRTGITDLTTVLKTDDEVTIWTQADGLVTQIKANRWVASSGAVIASLQKDSAPGNISIKYQNWNDPTQTYVYGSGSYTVADGAVITLNDQPAKLSDLAIDMIVYVAADSAGQTANTIKAYNKTAEGRITAKRIDQTPTSTKRYVSLDGVEYRINSTAWNMDDVTRTGSTSYTYFTVGGTMKVWLNKDNQIRVWDEIQGVANTGKLTAFNYNPSADSVYTMDVKGASTQYKAEKDATGYPLSTLQSKPLGGLNEIFKMTLNDKGDVKAITPVFMTITDTNPDPNVTTLAVTAMSDVYKVTYASPSDGMFKVQRMFTWNATTKALDPVVGGATESILVAADSAVYVNGIYANAASITKDSYLRFTWADQANSPKAAVVEADTFVKYDKTKFTMTATTLQGGSGAVEGSTDNGKTRVTVFTALLPGGNPDPASLVAWTEAWAGYSNAADASGYFAINATFNAGTTYYVCVSDRFGNFVTFTMSR